MCRTVVMKAMAAVELMIAAILGILLASSERLMMVVVLEVDLPVITILWVLLEALLLASKRGLVVGIAAFALATPQVPKRLSILFATLPILLIWTPPPRHSPNPCIAVPPCLPSVLPSRSPQLLVRMLCNVPSLRACFYQLAATWASRPGLGWA